MTVLRCRTCGRVITRYKGHIGKAERLRRIRRHYKRYHPKLFKEIIRKALRTKRKRGLIDKRK
ncbi:MAG: hypothetical protein ACKD6O_08125 [Candidatus Bathyarchaeota archaeon]